MGYSHGRSWSEEDVINEIQNVVKALDLDRMPTNKECIEVTKSCALSNVISKRGGFYHWGDKLGLKPKNSETLVGLEYEHIFNEEIIDLGYNSKITPVQFPYDVLIESATKVDVKVSRGYYNKKTGFYFTFNLEYKLPKCDFYVFYCVNEKMNKRLVIPAHVLTGIKQLSIGLKSKYDCYIDKTNLIIDHIGYMQELKYDLL